MAAEWDSTTTFCLKLTEAGEMDVDSAATTKKCAMKGGTTVKDGACKLKAVAVTPVAAGKQNTMQQCQDICTLTAGCTAVTWDSATKACATIASANKLVKKALAEGATSACAVKEFVTATGTCTHASNLVAVTGKETTVDAATCLAACQA